MEAASEQRTWPREPADPGAGQRRLRRGRQPEAAADRKRLGVDVGLQEPVEHGQAGRASVVEHDCHLAERAEVRRQLHRDRDGDDRLDRGEDLGVAAFGVPRGDQRVAGQVVDVQLDRGRARLFHGGGVVRPAARRHTVQRGDHRDVHRLGGPGNEVEVAVRPVPVARIGQVAGSLVVAVGVRLGEPGIPVGLGPQLLLEQRRQHDRADARRGQPLHARDGRGQRARRGDKRTAEGEAEVLGREVHQWLPAMNVTYVAEVANAAGTADAAVVAGAAAACTDGSGLSSVRIRHAFS